MYTEISFPSLGLTMNPPRNLEIGPFNIHFYGMIIALGLILAVVYACRRSKEFGIREDDLLDGVLWVTPFAILCARAYYCIFSWESYASDPIRVLYIWEGGLAIYGGVLGAIIGVTVFCKLKHIKLPMLLDLVSLGFLIGQSMGRWGNFFNREAFGAETTSFLRMGLLNTFTGNITGNGCILTLTSDLIHLIDVDNTALSALHIKVRSLQKTNQNVLHIVTHITGFGQRGRIGNSKGNV